MALAKAELFKSAQRGREFQLEQQISAVERLEKDEAARAPRARAIVGTVPSSNEAAQRLERLLEGNELTDVNYLERGVISGRAVARIVIQSRDRVVGHGTGFMVAPGVLMTNHHVLDRPDIVSESTAQFRYEVALDGTELTPVEFRLRTDIDPILHLENDLALVGVDRASTSGESLDSFGWLRLDPTPGKAVLGEFLTVIQHPNGERKQVCVRENRLIRYDPNGHYVWYQTDTVQGSSGAPVFNNSWDVVALHHSGVARTEEDEDGRIHYLNKDGERWTSDQGDDAIDWFANEGIRISRILRYLNDHHRDSELARAVLGAPVSPTTLGQVGATRGLSGSPSTGYSLPLSVPLVIRVGSGDAPSVGVGAAPPTTHPPALGPVLPSSLSSGVPLAAERSVSVDQSDYDDRNGYDPAFLGPEAHLFVPLPTVTEDAPGTLLDMQTGATLDYWNYTIQMNADRRLAYFCAANIKPALNKGTRPNDNWYLDPRIGDDETHQLGEEWYGGQKEFEAQRKLNPFDRGHLTSRQDLQWGETLAEANRNGDESYHWTNCAPQHLAFNQNRTINGLWRGVEEHVVLATGKRPLCIINGPVFDAPLSEDRNGVPVLQPGGERSPDPTFGGVAIPKQYFKIVAWKTDDGDLSAAGFVVSQEDVLRMVDRIVWDAIGPNPNEAGLTDEEVTLYQVPIATIGQLTGLAFQEQLSTHDTELLAQEAAGGGLITSFDDINLFG